MRNLQCVECDEVFQDILYARGHFGAQGAEGHILVSAYTLGLSMRDPKMRKRKAVQYFRQEDLTFHCNCREGSQFNLEGLRQHIKGLTEEEDKEHRGYAPQKKPDWHRSKPLSKGV